MLLTFDPKSFSWRKLRTTIPIKERENFCSPSGIVWGGIMADARMFAAEGSTRVIGMRS